MDFQFIIPTTNAELQNSNRNNYYVKQVYDAKELNNLLRGFCFYFVILIVVTIILF